MSRDPADVEHLSIHQDVTADSHRAAEPLQQPRDLPLHQRIWHEGILEPFELGQEIVCHVVVVRVVSVRRFERMRSESMQRARHPLWGALSRHPHRRAPNVAVEPLQLRAIGRVKQHQLGVERVSLRAALIRHRRPDVSHNSRDRCAVRYGEHSLRQGRIGL